MGARGKTAGHPGASHATLEPALGANDGRVGLTHDGGKGGWINVTEPRVPYRTCSVCPHVQGRSRVVLMEARRLTVNLCYE